MNKKLTVSIGIPVYNEEKNIGSLLTAISMQKNTGSLLKDIIIYDDKSTDKSVEVIKLYKNLPVKLIRGKVRKGKTTGLKKIFKASNADILILLDADIRILDKNLIRKILHYFKKDNAIMLLSGNKVPNPPRNFLERGEYSTFKVWYHSRKYIRNGDNLFACQGGVMALTKKLYKEINFPPIVSDDAYMYLYCKSKKYKFRYADDVIVYYKLASNLADYIKQYYRGLDSLPIHLSKYFGDLINLEKIRPRKLYLNSVIKTINDDPFPTIYIIGVNLLLKLFTPFVSKRYKPYWPISPSTK